MIKDASMFTEIYKQLLETKLTGDSENLIPVYLGFEKTNDKFWPKFVPDSGG